MYDERKNRMKKRVMSLLLVMLMVFALLPAAAMAADPVNPSQADSGDLHVTKKLEASGNGNYSITLESWATGNDFQIGGEALPMDIVLVLDQSGSMDEDISIPSGSYRSTNYISYNNIVSGIGYIKVNGEYKLLYASKSGNNYSYWYGNSNINGEGAVVILRNKNGFTRLDYDDVTPHIDLYVANTTTSSRIDALKSAVNSFVDTLSSQKDGADNVIEHRVAVVGYANGNKSDQSGYNTNTRENDNTIYYNTEVFVGGNQYRYDKVTGGNLADALQFTSTAAGKRSLQDSVSALSTWTDTYSNYGLELAKNILDARSDADKETRGAAVILFTDGVPGGGAYNDDSVSVANKSIDFAHQMKSNGVTIFTIGVLQDDTDYLPGRNGYDTDYHIYQYMNYVSSNYPDAASLDNPGEEKSNTYYSNISGGTGSLTDLFGQISDKIDQSSTSVDLSANSALRDIINLSDFDAAGATVSAQVVKMAADTPDAEITLSYPATVPADGVINVTGFDYSQLFHTDAHPGYKLVVTVNGLVPTHSGDLSSNADAAIYENITSTDPVISIDSPTLAVEKQANIIDFNTKMILAGNVSRLTATRTVNGAFDLASGELTYQLKPTETLGDRSGTLIMNGVDTAMAYNGTEWKEYQTIPANNIYFDDALLGATVDVADGAGYNVGVTSSAAQAVTDVADGSVLLYTFRGTGIDVYCTTNADGGYVQAGLMTGDTATAANLVYFESAEGHYFKDGSNYVRIDEEHPAPDGAQRYDSSLLAVRNYSITPAGEGDATLDRYNVPTVSYTGLPYGVYTVRIKAVDNANYKLDGIRVYNAMANDESVYAGTNEANARFYNLREALVNDGQEVVVKKQDESSKLNVYLPQQPSSALPGVLFIDNKDSVKIEKTIVDQNNNFVLDENGQPKKELVYKDAYSAYVANGPKNEIYLEKGQGIAFTISDDAQGDNYWLGLSIPDQGSTTASAVSVNGEAVTPTVASAVDMYYPITPRTDGTVVIVNNGDAMISVTNLKVTSKLAGDKSASPFALLSAEALDIVADSNAAAGQDDGGNQGLQELIRELISNFVKALFNSISRLFGK